MFMRLVLFLKKELIMDKNAKWIWLDSTHYPMYQKSEITYFDPHRKEYEYVVGEFKYEKQFNKEIASAKIDICADVAFRLYVNGGFVGAGPVCQGGDYANTLPMPKQYYNSYEIKANGSKITFYVLVRKNTSVQCDMSKGRPGLILSAEIRFADGTSARIVTDKSWLCRKDNTRYAENKTDYTLKSGGWLAAEELESVWNLTKAPIKMLCEEQIIPIGFSPITVGAKQSLELALEFDKIYSGYYTLSASCADMHDSYVIHITEYEKDEQKANIAETITASGDINFRCMGMHSAGAVKLTILNHSSSPLCIKSFAMQFCHYPTEHDGTFECSNETLNKAYLLGKHALKICRQTIELDSPMHQENLGCVGDYYIASLMNWFTYGDAALVRLDLVRIGDYIEMTDGYMFHTSFSMIWILMLWDYYLYSGDASIFAEVKNALIHLLERFDRYCDERGIIVSPDSYMFLDWLEADGISLHHPPACLGQAALNSFYHGGLDAAIKIFTLLNEADLISLYDSRKNKLKASFNMLFYDNEKGLYFDGLNESYEEKAWIPKNTVKRYFSWHTNTLAVLFDLAPNEKQAEIMERILADSSLINPQPYFMHFVLEAIYKTGLFEKHGISQLMRWRDMTSFPKGLQEGWYDMSGYGFDYSHVWGGTPTYQLPSKLSGLEILDAGFKKIRLTPRLFGLEEANISIPTPYGYIKLRLQKNHTPEIEIPEGIELVK